MSRLRPLLVLLAGLLLAGGLTALVLHERQARDEGREVVLRMQGFDPRDLLSGHYVAFTLVEPLRPGEMCPVTLIQRPTAGPPDPAERAWVALSPREDHWQATGAGASQAAAARLGVLTVRGRAVCEPGEPHQINLDLGLTRLHAAQDQAERLSRALRAGGENPPVYAVVSVGRDGRPRLKGVRLGNERIDLDW